ncbi:hypothetical protein QBC38DRAFT_506664 [Podospora fimiseda]|uniref:FAD-binding PCMH-type domain-containing protein n=1 Tax=Podospora fimiseda TaxID=252190 RepID=A0AAN7BXR7_9PEZI|nr:hypothetical protein QBC38DRAFT_506664 [Podospora fimiseda]
MFGGCGGSPEHRRAIASSNLLHRFSRPDCVVRPKTATQVQTITNEARQRNLKVTIKCNGHSYAGHSTAVVGISLDLHDMKDVLLDMNSKTVTMDAGCQWDMVYETLVIGKHDGYIINGGRCPTVGVSGFILGGGLGPFTRSFGMGCDTLVEVKIVTADGKLVTVGKDSKPGSPEAKLFWALQGAGGANFGVVVQMKLSVQKLSSLNGMVVAGRYRWLPEGGFTNDTLKIMNGFYLIDWPRQMTIDTTWICDLRESNNKGAIRFTISFDGSQDTYNRTIDKQLFKLKEQLKRRALAEKSTRYLHESLASQWVEKMERAYPKNKSYELYSSFCFANDDKRIIEQATAAIAERMATFRQDGWMERDMRMFLASVKKRLRPLSLNGTAAFINFPDRDFPTKSHERAYFGENRDELREIKQMWDPEKFFAWSQGVRRPGDPEEDRGVDDEDDDEAKADKLAREEWGKRGWEFSEPRDMNAEADRLADLGFDEFSDDD